VIEFDIKYTKSTQNLASHLWCVLPQPSKQLLLSFTQYFQIIKPTGFIIYSIFCWICKLFITHSKIPQCEKHIHHEVQLIPTASVLIWSNRHNTCTRKSSKKNQTLYSYGSIEYTVYMYLVILASGTFNRFF
jgi:hypothetical protein